MSLEENAIRRWDSPTHLSEQPSFRFIDRLIRLKITYWNRGYAIFLLGLIALSITSLQFSTYNRFLEFMEQQNKIDYTHFNCLSYNMDGYIIGLIPGGLLATVYPAHNILGIFVVVSSIGHLIAITSISYFNTLTHCILQFCIGTAMAVVDTSIDRVWTFWVPQDKQAIRHAPIVLYSLIYYGEYLHETIDKFHDTNSSYTLTLFIGVIGLAWYVLWLYAINGNYSFWSLNSDFILFGGSNNSRHSFGTYGVSLTRSIISDIPWKSICTSKPVLVVAVLYVWDSILMQSYYFSALYGDYVFEWTTRNYTITLLFPFVVLVELVPEITASISTSSVRKFWSCLYFGSTGIYFVLEAILGDTVTTNKMCQYFFKEMHYLSYFGFYINILDIAPKYASLLYGLLLSIHYISSHLWSNAVNIILNSEMLNKIESAILMMIICFTVAVLYANFASVELQPWAADESEEENQQNIVENDNKL
ncbi:hypothetical protein ACI65C_009653 [Semiaphis heraclei]